MVLKSLKNIFGKGKKRKKKKEVAKDDSSGNIRVKAVIELLGAPKEYIEKTIRAYVDKIAKEKGLKLVNKYIAEAQPQGKLFVTFTELELLFKSPTKLIDFCFDFMPASVEIIEPEKISFEAREITNMLNDMQARIHTIDMRLKNLIAENKILNKNAHLILRNNILLSLREREKTLDEIAKNIGIPEEKTKIFLDSMIAKRLIKKEGDKYSLLE